MYGITFVNVMLAANLLFASQESEAIPHRKTSPTLSPLALQILYSSGGIRDQIIQELRNQKKLSQLESFGVQKSEIESLLFYLSDHDLFILQKVFILSFK